MAKYVPSEHNNNMFPDPDKIFYSILKYNIYFQHYYTFLMLGLGTRSTLLKVREKIITHYGLYFPETRHTHV